MTYIVKFANNEQLTEDDLNDIGKSQRQTFDFLTKDAIDSSLKFADFPVVQTNATSVNVGAGRLYRGGEMYSNEDAGGVAFPLLQYLPSANGNQKIISIVATAKPQDSQGVPRTFLTNAATNATEANQVATQAQRLALLSTAVGQESASPQPQPMTSDQCEVARITLGFSGIVKIEYVEDNRLETVTKLGIRAKSLETWKAQAGSQLDTMRTDIATLAARYEGLPSQAIFGQIVRYLAETGAKSRVPQAAINFHYDYLLNEAESSSDPSQASYLCNVQEGIRFPWAAQALGILQLQNPNEPRIKAGSGIKMMLPDYTEAARIDVIGNDGSLSLSQYQYQNIAVVQKSISRQVTNFGNSFTVCQNSTFWNSGKYNPQTGIFTKAGETYTVDFAGYMNNVHKRLNLATVRLTQYWKSTQVDTYSEAVVNNYTVSGSTKSQTFLNSQAGWMTSVELAFSQVGETGDVTVLVCDTTDSGAPNFKSVVATSTVAAADLKVWPRTTKFAINPCFLEAGNRYAVMCVTGGNHFICYVNGNKYAQGSAFDSTDGAFSIGDPTKDLAIRVNFAKFATTITQVEFQPLTLQNGITDIQLLYGTKVPAGCDLIWEIQKTGSSVWYPLQSYAQGSTTNPMLGLPPLVRLRVTYVGTTDLMPGIDMTQTQTLVSRPGAAYQHWTLPISIGASSSSIRVEVTVDAFDPAAHTVGCQLKIAGSNVNPSTSSTTVDPNNPARFIKGFTFALGSPTTTFAIGINGTTNAVTKVYHVEGRFDYES